MTALPSALIVAVVDDDETVLESLGSLLDSADYGAHLFDSGAAMLESGCLSRICCLISDINMPAMDGFELLRAVRAERPDLPVILITGQSNKLNQPPPPGLPHFLLLKKPFSPTDLLLMIREGLPTRI